MANSPFLSGHAKWIWVSEFDDTAAVGQFVYFRRTFELQRLPDSDVPLHVSADTRYQLYLNGHRLSWGPCKSYETRWNYETVNITPFLVQGTNVLAAHVLRLSSTSPGCLSMIRTAFPGLIVHCELPDGSSVHTDEDWKANKDAGTQLAAESEWDYRLGPSFLNLNERVDGRLRGRGWLTSPFNDSPWPNAIVKTLRRKMSPMLDPRRLFPREIPALSDEKRRFDAIVTCTGSAGEEAWRGLVSRDDPVVIPPNSRQTVDIESKVLTTGFLDLVCDFDGSEENSPTIEILCAECYENSMEDGKPRRKGDRSDYRNGKLYGPIDIYTPCRGTNNYSPFWFRTFRYVRLSITTAAVPLTLTGFTYRATHYPLSIRTTIQTSSELFSKLWTISINTLRNCMHETYEDCPFYEQNQFAMDTRTQILLTYLLSRDDRLARKTMREFYASRREDGLVETHFPSPGRSINIPTFSLFWVLMIWDYMVHFGDARLVRGYAGAVDGVLDYFDARIGPLGLVGQFDADCWAFVDWVDGWATPGKGFTGLAVPRAYYTKGSATYHSLLYAYTLLKASELATFLGRTDTAAEYRGRQEAIIAAVRTHCFDPATGFFLDGPGATGELSQHVQVFAVLSGCVAGEEARDLMLRTVLHRERHNLARASFALGFYVFRAVSLAGAYEECWATLIAPWEKMIGQNLTTWAESDSMERSDCHGWSATPLYEIGTEILGVKQHCRAYLDTVKVGRNEAEVQVAPKPNLVDDIQATVIVGDNGRDMIQVGWGMGKQLYVKSEGEVQVKVLQDR